jgi:hypothetical protein
VRAAARCDEDCAPLMKRSSPSRRPCASRRSMASRLR